MSSLWIALTNGKMNLKYLKSSSLLFFNESPWLTNLRIIFFLFANLFLSFSGKGRSPTIRLYTICTMAVNCDFSIDCSNGAPQGYWESGEDSYLFSGIWGTLVIIFMDLGSKLIVFGIYGVLQTSKKLTLKEKPSFCLIFK